jgi:hypothetical protein
MYPLEHAATISVAKADKCLRIGAIVSPTFRGDHGHGGEHSTDDY